MNAKLKIAVAVIHVLLLSLAALAVAQSGTVLSSLKISELAGNFTPSNAGGTLDDGDFFSVSLTGLGDLDGDSMADLAVGVLFDDDGGMDKGAVYVLFLNSNGTVKASQKISDTAGNFTPGNAGGTLDNDDQFGISVTGLGDLDGDGNFDLAVGAIRDDDGGTDNGAVYVLFLNSDGAVKASQKISEVAGNFTPGNAGGTLDDGDEFGFSVAGLGDLDGDGKPDLIVGAIQDDDGGGANGAVYVLFLNSDGTVRASQKISETAGNFTAGNAGGTLDDGDFFGHYVAGLGDLDGDGNFDLAVGAPRDDDGGTENGAVYVLFLNSDGTVKASQKISETTGNFTAGNAGGTLDDVDSFGHSVAGLGDLDGDGKPDLVVGASFDDDGGTDNGAAYVLFLNSDGTVKVAQKISETAGNFTTGNAGGTLDDFDNFGRSVARLGDLDGDSKVDLAVGALADDDGGTDNGAVYVLFLEGAPVTSVFDDNEEDADLTSIPTEFKLDQNYPNPFNPNTTISFAVPKAGEITLAIYNLRGQLVKTLLSRPVASGRHKVLWDGTDSRGAKVASSIYLYRLEAKDFTATKKIVLAK